VVSQALHDMGVRVVPTDDGMIIEGCPACAKNGIAHAYAGLHGAVIDSHGDHRIAMSFAVAALLADSETKIKGAECVGISYPTFFDDLSSLAEC